ncbi:MAG: hypothetical protein FWE11_01595 [Defluviitaleaceae bacterium]|nr:hypothetical protein [Defluviitaleaceae bacterium]
MDFLSYDALAKGFADYIYDPANGICYQDEEGNTYFTAYCEGNGNEMVTWGILAVGDALMGTQSWGGKARTFEKYFHPVHGLYTNTPGSTKTEYWYLLYVNTLAGAVYRSVFPDCENVKQKMITATESLSKMAISINHDFNDQGYDFVRGTPWTNKDIYRQPDSIGGYAYNMLFAGIHGGRDDFIQEAASALEKYTSFESNPWYEIPNGATAVLAAAWLHKNGYEVNLEKTLDYIFDTKEGPLQAGQWNGKPVDGLMMGWRGDDREYAESSAYSMETLMPLPFILPAVKYEPSIGKRVAIHALNAVTNFELFYGNGIYQTRPDLSDAVPYEKLEKSRDGHSPAACGDFMGHRSVYGGGYLAWIATIMRPTGCGDMPAWDLSLTDWLATGNPEPTFMLYNQSKKEKTVKFAPHKVWQKKRPDLYPGGVLKGNVLSGQVHGEIEDGQINLIIPPESVVVITLKP